MNAPLRHAWNERINQGIAPRYHDRQLGCDVIKVMPGEYEVTDSEDALVTLLGSCVAACIRDPLAGVGGMNHFMLPDTEALGGARNARYGAYAMEVLINELIKRGGNRRRLEAKVFGGANVIRGLSANPVGDRNAAFVLDYLKNEGITVAAQDLGGTAARKVAYWVSSGRVLVRHLPTAATAADLAVEQAYSRQISSQPVDGDVELFD
ncbi:chemoreceptor glutamine deamidase CheD [Sinimarinibacterium sp. CAU 1509]|uniref:chemoreceptor glutamine deamidase CheD n=1 Tax=Sinimarinibacterium sp. CAU 1509 TaxID=2562283 RepID=UPI0010AD9A6A|nr:chemoreceptor glutamine deamidase CheD [Sinimarinibacterium sp. CAU 1509]TJY62825.1 chemoreceptor glutamine deamidase CheD [Sinimarinibacterium sp. CAU 1509]